MAIIDYEGHKIVINTAYSYNRVSSRRQGEGEGIDRQIGRSRQWCSDRGIPLDNELTDLRSGSKGDHIAEQSPLGAFLDLIRDRKLKPHAALIVESFSRLGRLTIMDALRVFEQIVNRGCTLVTLVDQRIYTREIINANPGLMHMVVAHLQSARAESDAKSDYAAQSWVKRRGTVAGAFPSWISRVGDQLVIDVEKQRILTRVFQDASQIGLAKLAITLNDEQVPLFCDRKRKRGVAIWDAMALYRLIRSRTTLGYQGVGRWIGGKRVLSGEILAYPAAISDELWHQANAAIDNRRTGTQRGRNVVRMTNLFGDLARCSECRGRMKIRERGLNNQYFYLGCSNAKHGKCSVTKYHRLDRIEQRLLPKIAAELIDDTVADDPANVLESLISTAKTAADRLANRYATMFERFADAEPDSLAAKNLIKLDADHRAKIAEIAKMERQLATLRVRPSCATRDAVAGLVGAALTGDIESRRQVAIALPALLRSITFRPDGLVFVAAAAGFTWKTRNGKFLGITSADDRSETALLGFHT